MIDVSVHSTRGCVVVVVITGFAHGDESLSIRGPHEILYGVNSLLGFTTCGSS